MFGGHWKLEGGHGIGATVVTLSSSLFVSVLDTLGGNLFTLRETVWVFKCYCGNVTVGRIGQLLDLFSQLHQWFTHSLFLSYSCPPSLCCRLFWSSKVWWHMHVMSALGSLRQEDCHEFGATLGYIYWVLGYPKLLRRRKQNSIKHPKYYISFIYV